MPMPYPAELHRRAVALVRRPAGRCFGSRYVPACSL